MTCCKPCQMVLAPGSPSPLRPRKPPSCATGRDLRDAFIVKELGVREHQDARRIRPVLVALQNQRDDLLAFAGVLDEKPAAIAQAEQVPEYLVRAACVLHRKPTTSPAYWQGWGRLRSKLGAEFHAVFAAVAQVMEHTPRSSSLVENLNCERRSESAIRRRRIRAMLNETYLLFARESLVEA